MGFYLHVCLFWYFQRTHGLFGNRVDSFSSEPTNAQSQQMTNQRPLQFSESQPESPPNSSALVPTTEFFPTTAPKSNTNNNAFAEWVQNALSSIKGTRWRTLKVSDWWPFLLSFRFSFEREGSPVEFYNPNEDAEPGMSINQSNFIWLTPFIQVSVVQRDNCPGLETLKY